MMMAINVDIYPEERVKTGRRRTSDPTIPLITPKTAYMGEMVSSESKSMLKIYNKNLLAYSSSFIIPACCYLIILTNYSEYLIIMKQEQSILQWASHVLEEPVSNLKAIQDVKFVKNFLWKTDDVYFNDWYEGYGDQSYSNVLQKIGKYFKQEIGTDISQQLATINVYKNVIDVWELLLCIAIKGNNRNNNINIIFELDHSIQSELVAIVSSIIDKFGQNTAQIQRDEVNEEKEATNDRQIVIELLQENEALKEDVARLQLELNKEEEDRKAMRKEYQQNLQKMRLEKLSFLQIMANANRNDSKIFEDGDGGVLQSQSNLSQLAQDIVQFIRQQRRTILKENQKNMQLEDKIKMLRQNISQCAEENENYLNKLGDLKNYQKQIQLLRSQNQQKFEEILYLQELISQLQNEKSNLVLKIQKQTFDEFSQQNTSPKQADRNNSAQKKKPSRMAKKNTMPGNNEMGQSRYSSEDGSKGIYTSVISQSQEISKRQMDDELREPQLRNKLQREVTYLKKNINGLHKQIEALKKANEALQRSAKTFMDSNQKVITKWEDDYQILIQKMGSLNDINQNLKEENKNDKQALANLQQIKEDKHKNNKLEMKDNLEMKTFITPNNPNENQQKQEIKMVQKSRKQKMEKVALWDEIVKKLRQIIRQGKSKELAYENSLLSLRNENFKLVQLLRNKNESKSILNLIRIQSNQSQSIRKTQNPIENGFYLNVQRVDSQQMRQSKSRLVPPRLLSQIQIQQGDQLQQSMVRSRQKSHFYNLESRIIHQMDQKTVQNKAIGNSQQYYTNLNKRLSSSIRQSFQNLNHRITEQNLSGSVELQRKMEQQIKQITDQYKRLNNNYQNVFNKLHIYTQNLKEKEFVKEGYENVLQEISKAESEIKASHEAEIVKLRILNQSLRQQVTESVIEKQQFAHHINELSASIKILKSKQQKNKQHSLLEMERVLTQLNNRYNENIKDPLSFLQSCLEGSKEEGQLQKFYRLYIKEKDRTRQLNEQLQLLSSVLLEYRNMIAF